MQFTRSVIACALAGAVSAATPPGFEPAVTTDLFVAFGDEIATNGVVVPKGDTASPPTLGTSEKLFGTYTVMMVDPDIPPAAVGGPTSELLHWLQPGLVSADTATTIGGNQVFVLTNPNNISAIATYIQPSPPAKVPLSHRYTQLLLNTTGNSSSMSTLMSSGTTRTNFSAVNVLKAAGLTPLFGNSFNVTNTTGFTQSPITNATGTGVTTSTVLSTTTSRATATGSTNGTSNGLPKSVNGAAVNVAGAVVAGLGALVAALAIL